MSKFRLYNSTREYLIAFTRFVYFHRLTPQEMDDTEYLEKLYENFKEEQ